MKIGTKLKNGYKYAKYPKALRFAPPKMCPKFPTNIESAEIVAKPKKIKIAEVIIK